MRILVPAAIALAAVAASSACAQQYPSKPVRIIVAAAPSGGTDFMARLVGQRLGEVLGQQVIVENRPGAGSTLGFQMTHVPYKGGGPALIDVISGQIQLVFATPQAGLPQVKAKRVRAVAVTTPERVAAAPDVPTVAESGVPGYEVTNWRKVVTAAGVKVQ